MTKASDNSNPFVRWRIRHPSNTLDLETERAIQQWSRVNHELYELMEIADEAIVPWSEKAQNAHVPDLVAYIAGYGYSRTVTGDWKSLPIEIPDSELADWEENSGIVHTMEKLRRYQGGIAGVVPRLLFARKDDAIGLINVQLKRLYDELDLLVARPIADFLPTQWDEEALYQEVVGEEIKKLDRIFDVYEELWCFEQGIEELRMLMITEDDPDFHLPSKEFYDALVSVSSHELLRVLDAAEPKLREILRTWSNTRMVYSGKPYHRPYDQDAPEVFWWRHEQAKRRPRSNSK